MLEQPGDTPAANAEIRRRNKFLLAIANGEKPKGDPSSYAGRLGLIFINSDGSYSLSKKGVWFLDDYTETEFWDDKNDCEPRPERATDTEVKELLKRRAAYTQPAWP